jgi:hypothetical protein
MEVLQRCRDWEVSSDPTGHELPRSKVSDDKALTAVLLGH